jgi:hypothetical protein
MRVGRTSIALAAAVALLVAGCGGGGGGDESSEAKPVSTATTTGLTKAETIEQGDAICAKANAAIGSVGGEMFVKAEKIAELYIEMTNGLKGLSPSEESVAYAEFAAVASKFETAENDVSLTAAPRTAQAAAALKPAEAKASAALSALQEAASEYGFKACTEDPSASAEARSGG